MTRREKATGSERRAETRNGLWLFSASAKGEGQVGDMEEDVARPPLQRTEVLFLMQKPFFFYCMAFPLARRLLMLFS